MTISKKVETLLNELKQTPVRIVAVTKFANIEQMVQAYEAGLIDFGENKLQTFSQKWPDLPEDLKDNVRWHFIGHLQTNKVKKVVGVFNLIHSVDTVKLAKAISEAAIDINVTQDILLEINISGEPSKYGFSKENIINSFPEIRNLENIKIKGLMTMAPFIDDPNLQKATFQGLRELRDELQNIYNYSLPELSMGMTNDYKIAVQEGSTIVRIGQKIFS